MKLHKLALFLVIKKTSIWKSTTDQSWKLTISLCDLSEILFKENCQIWNSSATCSCIESLRKALRLSKEPRYKGFKEDGTNYW